MYRSDKREKSFLRVQFGIFDQIISFRLSLPLLPVSRKKGKTRSEHKKTFKVACADTTSKTQPVVWKTVARVLKNLADPKIKLEVKGKVGFFFEMKAKRGADQLFFSSLWHVGVQGWLPACLLVKCHRHQTTANNHCRFP